MVAREQRSLVVEVSSSTGALIVTVAGRVEGAAAVALNSYLHRCLDEHPACRSSTFRGARAARLPV
jgi:hypothetical protein